MPVEADDGRELLRTQLPDMLVGPPVHISCKLKYPAEFDESGSLESGDGTFPDFGNDILTSSLYQILDRVIKELAFKRWMTLNPVKNNCAQKTVLAIRLRDTETYRRSGILCYPASFRIAQQEILKFFSCLGDPSRCPGTFCREVEICAFHFAYSLRHPSTCVVSEDVSAPDDFLTRHPRRQLDINQSGSRA